MDLEYELGHILYKDLNPFQSTKVPSMNKFCKKTLLSSESQKKWNDVQFFTSVVHDGGALHFFLRNKWPTETIFDYIFQPFQIILANQDQNEF